MTEPPRPSAPVVGVGGVVIHEDRVLLIRRGKEPLRGRWSVPGGRVELGESLDEAVVREVLEETRVRVEPLELVAVFDRIEHDGSGVSSHYVVLDYLCRFLSGVAQADSDAAEVAWASREQLGGYDLPPKALEVVSDGFRRASRLAGRESRA